MDAVVQLEMWRDMYLDLAVHEMARMQEVATQNDKASLCTLRSGLELLTYYVHKAYNAGVFLSDLQKDALCACEKPCKD